MAKNIISIYLADLYISRISNGVFSEKLKLAKVVPLFKSGSRLNLSNYRPIFLLSQFGKIFEKLLYININKFLDQHNVNYSEQYGFRRGYSIALPLLKLSDHLLTQNGNDLATAAVFLDIKKTFDIVDHPILLNKAYHYGIRGVANDLFRSYLNNRKQFVLCEPKKIQPKYYKMWCPSRFHTRPKAVSNFH